MSENAQIDETAGTDVNDALVTAVSSIWAFSDITGPPG